MQQEQDSSWVDYGEMFDEVTSDVDTSSTPEGWGLPLTQNLGDGGDGEGGKDTSSAIHPGLKALRDMKNYAIGDENTTQNNEAHPVQNEVNRMLDPVVSFGTAFLGKKAVGMLGGLARGNYITRPVGLMAGWQGYKLGEELLRDSGMHEYAQSAIKGTAGLTAYEGSIWAAGKAGKFATSQITNFSQGLVAYGESAKIITEKVVQEAGQKIETSRASGKLLEGAAKKIRQSIPSHISQELSKLNRRIPEYVTKKLQGSDKKLYKSLKDVITDKNFYSRMIKWVGQKSPQLAQKWTAMATASAGATGSIGVGNVIGPVIGIGLNAFLAAEVIDYAMSEEGGEFYDWLYGSVYPKSMIGKGNVYGEAAKKGNVPIVDRAGMPLPGKEQRYGWNPDKSLQSHSAEMEGRYGDSYKLPPMGSEIVTGGSISDWLQESGIIE